MRSCSRLASSIVLASFALAACGGSSTDSGAGAPTAEEKVARSSLARDTAPDVAASDLAALAASNAAFGFDLYHAVTGSDPSSNLFYSPFSVSIALAMTYAGAQGTTATQMANALHFDLPPEKLHPAFDALDLALASRSSQAGKGFHLDVADSLWAEQTIAFQPKFLDTLAVSYGGEVHLADFLGRPDAERVAINGWVSDHTAQKIPELLPDGSIASDTRFVLVNAIYFDAAWASPFEASMTKPGTFHRADGSAKSADLMSQFYEGVPYAKGDGWQAVELAYDGNQTSMVLLVPDEGKLAAVDGALDAAFWASAVSSFANESVSLTMPKFTIPGATISLKSELAKLGMVDAFDPNAADLGAMIAPGQGPTWIGDVLHQAFVRVDEHGTEAAAATAVIGVGSAAPVDIVTLTIDRPFYFAIRDVPTNSVLFFGRLTDPS